MVSLNITLEVSKSKQGFDVYIGDDIGGSGISVKAKNATECVERLTPYITDYLENL